MLRWPDGMPRLMGMGRFDSTDADGANGACLVASPEPGWSLFCLVSDGEGWDHVSARATRADLRTSRVPTWKEMVHLRRLFWDPEDCVMALFPPEQDYINHHPHVLHLWRPQHAEIPRPPQSFV